MAVTHSATARDAATNAVVDLLDGAASKLKFRVGGTIGSPGAVAATLTFADAGLRRQLGRHGDGRRDHLRHERGRQRLAGLESVARDLRRRAAHLLRRGGQRERHQHDQRADDRQR
ncbi:MAG: hypothetical protein MZW92_31950 [Comamonadaceae bacterium]|nr:hypothetical protein [Comamonadaceae bacterium]